MKKLYFILIFLISFITFPRIADAQFEVWGTSRYGGTNYYGNIFKADATGTMVQTVFSFSGGVDGMYPESGLIRASNGLIYGTTLQGGTNNLGVLFALDPATGNMVNTFSLDGATSGGLPRGDLFEASNGKIYGMTYNGGANNMGTFFEIDPVSFAFTKKADFNGSGNGASPSGSVLMEASNGKLYAVLGQGGASNAGVILEYDLNTSALTKVADFTSPVTGSGAGGRLIETSPGIFYGATESGTPGGFGGIFEFDLGTSVITPKAMFIDSITGYEPKSGLMQASNNKLYGVTYNGGPGWSGTLIEYDIASNTFTNVLDFASLDTGALNTFEAWCIPLEASNGKLYCTSTYGGSGNGSIFTYDFINDTYEVLVDLFSAGSDAPYGQQLLEMPLQITSVWPGDCNYDLVADNYDFLNIGLAWNDAGPVRPGATINWTPQLSNDWSQNFSNGLNLKHADTNGDGNVNGSDSLAILQNYGLSHPFRIGNPAPASIGDFHLVPVSSAVAPGQPVTFNLVAGSTLLPINNLYGIAFRLSFDASLVAPPVSFDFSSSLLGTLNSNLEVLTKNMYGDGYIDIAMTRTDHINAVNVNGSLGTISITAASNITSVTTLEVTPVQVMITTASGNWSGLYPLQDPVLIDPALSGLHNPDGISDLQVFPNPAQDQIRVYWGGYESALVELFDMTGKRIFSKSYEADGAGIDIAAFDNGIYQLSVRTGSESNTRKLVIAR